MTGSDQKIVLVKRSTRLEELVARFNTVLQAKFYIEHLGADFADYLREDEIYRRAIVDTEKILAAYGRVQVVDRSFVPNFIFGPEALVVAVGQDGLVANTMKYLDRQLLIGINPDPKRWDGVLLPFKVGDMELIIPEVLRLGRPVKEISMAKAQLNDGQSLYAVNDLFFGQRTHVSARYLIRSGQKEEQQSSSGVIVSTGLGSTAWLRSVVTGAAAVIRTLTRQPDDKINPEVKMSWDSDYLVYSVREPFPSRITRTELVFGRVTSKEPLVLRSLMADNGVIFSDGVENDFLQFNSGIEAKISVAEKKGRLVV